MMRHSPKAPFTQRVLGIGRITVSMALSLLSGQLQRCLAAPALSRLLPQLWQLGQQQAAVQSPFRSAAIHTSSWQGCIAEDQQRKALANRLLYRSRQRGFLELDLLVGLWAEKNIPTMDVNMLLHLSEVLDQENPDLFKWLTGQLPPSEQMLQNRAYLALREAVKAQMEENSNSATHAASGKDWVRGWDDWKKEGPEPGPAAS